MPGIIGLVGAADTGRMARALTKLSYLDTYRTSLYPISPTVTLGYVGRPSQGEFASGNPNQHPRCSVLVTGAIFTQDSRPRRISANQIIDHYQADGLRHLRESYDGSFVIVVVDLDSQRLHVGTDRVGSQPVYYRRIGSVLAFGPEVKALATAADWDPELAESGLINLLTTGYNLGRHTIYSGVHALEPGSILSCDLSTGTLSRERYWKIVYDPAPALSRRGSAVEALFESTRRAHQLHLSDSPREFDLFLSGGLDSRGILGVLQQLGAMPTRALGWGMRDDIPGSDAWIAKRLAEEFGLDFSFLAYDTDQLAEIAEDWVYVSELANDNIGRYGEGMGAVRNFYHTGADFTFVGDEAWGWRGYAGNEIEARAHVLPPFLPSRLRSILRSSEVDRLESSYHQSINEIMEPCENPDPTDRKDFLYLHGRVARFIFSLGYYREISSEMRRPFLANEVLDVVRRVPQAFRVHKNLYVTMLKRFLPRTMTYPEMEVPSLPDWSYDLRYREPMRSFFRGLLEYSNLEAGPLGAMIDRTAFERARDEFFASAVSPVNRQTSGKIRLKRAARQALLARPRLERLLTRARRRMGPASPSSALDPLWRIALCVLLERNLKRFRAG
ncbi:MAG TPA: asparagine synthase-related protein [Gemmatimonadales bacterium]|nr:asparagine synthase-related protein [Gemmatimonadales bacterium]